MGQRTKLYISDKWSLEDVVTVLENWVDLKEKYEYKKTIRKEKIKNAYKVKVKSTGCLGMQHICFNFNNEERLLTYFEQTDLPTKNMHELRLGYDEDAIKIMTTIANVLGGLLEENDCGSEGITEISGLMDENNGLRYFIKWAILNHKVDDVHNLKQLNSAIHGWYDRIDSQGKDLKKLFKKEE